MSAREDRGVRRPSGSGSTATTRRSSTESGTIRRSSVNADVDTRSLAENNSSSSSKDATLPLPGPVTSFLIILFVIPLGGYFMSPIRAVPMRGIVAVDLTSSFELNTKLAEGKR